MSAFEETMQDVAWDTLKSHFGDSCTYRRYLNGAVVDGYPVPLTAVILEGDVTRPVDDDEKAQTRVGIATFSLDDIADPTPETDTIHDGTREWVITRLVSIAGGVAEVEVRTRETVQHTRKERFIERP